MCEVCDIQSEYIQELESKYDDSLHIAEQICQSMLRAFILMRGRVQDEEWASAMQIINNLILDTITMSATYEKARTINEAYRRQAVYTPADIFLEH